MTALAARLAPNWTTVAGALEGILEFLGAPLPRYAVMGLTAHAWHFHLGEREGIVALPSGPTDLDWDAMLRRYARTGYRWERFTAPATRREEAIAWAAARLEKGLPLIGWDMRLHDFAVVYGIDRGGRAFLVDDRVSGQTGDVAPWDSWPSEAVGRIDLFAPVEPVEDDPAGAIVDSLADAVAFLHGSGANSGCNGLERWAEAFDSEIEIDRAGNAYTLQVLQAARLDGADYLGNLRDLFPQAASEINEAIDTVRALVTTLAPLVTLFPFPAGGHGNISNPGLREAAAAALRRAAGHQRDLAIAIAGVHKAIESE